ncbi:hypothetical protein QBC41DRAFT_360438 [Cercophora samala]|uniref:Uncharacterized protein n=1 Tax=Cercophora samala TaxID=330535 RepID=A0AA39YWP0_9PEZI|nr:hypothetical protein QBC41DRAFT_360438 [Cercophora samala]
MRGDAYDLQDLIKFSVISLECNLLYPPDIGKKFKQEVLPGLHRNLICFVADLIQEFVKTVELTEQSTSHRDAEDLRDHIRHLQLLNATRYPFPKKKRHSQEDLLDWEKRNELRLLPGDDGFGGWRTAKALFRERVRVFLCKPEVEELFYTDLEDYDQVEDGEYKDMVDGFLEQCFPFQH